MKVNVFEKLKNIKNKEIIIAIVLFIVVLFIFFSSNLFSATKTSKKIITEEVINTETSSYYISSSEYSKKLEERLTNLLSKVNGVQNVSCMITVESSPEITIYENTEENIKAIADGTKSVIKEAVIIKDGSIERPIVLLEKCPKIKGVLIVYNGGDTNLKLNIIKAVQVLLDIDANRATRLQ